MLILVTGGAASGKSGYAEKLAVEIHAELVKKRGSGTDTDMYVETAPALWYLATMRHDQKDRETEERIKKHRRQRQGKGFTTIEQPDNISAVGNRVRSGDTILLEDLSNLLANELFPQDHNDWNDTACSDEWIHNDSKETFRLFLRKRIIAPILELSRSGIRIVAVGSRIAEDMPSDLDEDTRCYVKELQILQAELGQAADRVVEVVCGIPVIIKG